MDVPDGDVAVAIGFAVIALAGMVFSFIAAGRLARDWPVTQASAGPVNERLPWPISAGASGQPTWGTPGPAEIA